MKIFQMNKKNVSLLVIISFSCLMFYQCKSKSEETGVKEDKIELKSDIEKEKTSDPAPLPSDNKTSSNPVKPIPSAWSEITTDEGFKVEMKYATTDNFTKKKIYDCGKCFLRPEAANKLRQIQKELNEKYGYGIKVFDCFRPRPYQQRLWDIVPDPDYVTPPQKGSMHSRGLAVDLTIVDNNGDELDMGTAFDFFGKEAHQDYKGHSKEINKNREILRSTMEKFGFKSIRTEWWHYSYGAVSYQLDEWVWNCN